MTQFEDDVKDGIDFDEVDASKEEILGAGEEKETGKEPEASPFTGDDIPEELRGKTPTEVVAHYLEVKNAGAKMAEIALSQRQPAQAAPAPPPPLEPPAKITSEDFLDESVDINEKIAAIAEHKIEPYRNQMIQTAARNTYDRAFQVSPHLADYKVEVDKLIAQRQLTNEQIANPDTWAVIDAHILRTHAKDIYEKYTAAPARKPAPPDEIRGNARLGPSGEGKTKLTAEQKHFAKVLGVSAEDAEQYTTED